MPGPGPLSAGDPERIGGYRLTGVLGEGGQGAVYLAESPRGHRVAVKVLHARMAADPVARERFLREAEVIRRIAVFCTARVLDAGIVGDRPYLVSEYIPGPSLHDLIADEGPRAGSGLERLAVTTLTALEAIHRAGVVHRDVKPRNAIMGPEGPVVIDFGIARTLDRTSTSSELVGLPAYLAPEQLNGAEAGPASDVFSWAATIVYAATGHPAFPGNVQAAVMNAVLNREPDLTGTPGRLRPLLAACLAKDPAARPAVSDVLGELTRREPGSGSGAGAGSGTGTGTGSGTGVGAGSGLPAGFQRPAAEPRPVPRRLLTAAGSVVTALLLVGGVVWFQQPDVSGSPRSGASGASGAAGSSRPDVSGAPDRASGASVVSLEHGGTVWTMAAARLDGRPVIVSGDEKTVRVWNPTTGEPIGTPFPGHAGGVSSVAVAELEGRPVVVSGGHDRTVRVWDLATGEPVGAPFTGHTGGVVSTVGPGQQGRPVVVSGGDDRTARVWNPLSPRPSPSS
ncbi:serine/threonine-protein kinase [Planobispora longispora]|uniref:serine/threonine-protein kinase n=1 Tax=Planobispora longispora TaxID=28887 RepID=UPI001943D408|nr:serine/threonine-protein kinase [Planobispora longispora]